MKADELAKLASSSNPPTADMLAVYTLLDVIEKWNTIMAAGMISNEDAYNEFMESATTIFEEAEEMVVRNPDKVQYNILPAAFNLISNGLYGKNDLVKVETICTAVDISELQLNK